MKFQEQRDFLERLCSMKRKMASVRTPGLCSRRVVPPPAAAAAAAPSGNRFTAHPTLMGVSEGGAHSSVLFEV